MTQIKPLKIVSTFAVAVICCAALAAHAGGGMSGGGFGTPAIKNPSSLILVDYLANSDITPKNELTGEGTGINTDYSLVGAKEIKTLSAQRLALSRVEKWKGEYTVLVKILEHYLNTMNWDFSDEKVKTPDEMYVYMNASIESDIRPVLYFDYCKGVTANSNDYSAFTPASQSGSMLHESFRQVQIRHKSLFPVNFNTAKIQRMVTLMMFSEPQKLSVQDRELFSIFKSANYTTIETKLAAFKNDYCKNTIAQLGPKEICMLSANDLLEKQNLGVILHDLSDFVTDLIIKAHELTQATKYREYSVQVSDVIQDLVEINVSANTVQYRDAVLNMSCKVSEGLSE